MPRPDHEHAEGVVFCGGCQGVWTVTTETGTVYELDLDARTATRRPSRSGAPIWLDAGDGPHDPPAVVIPAEPRKLGPLPLIRLGEVRLGEPLELALSEDGADTTRSSTPVRTTTPAGGVGIALLPGGDVLRGFHHPRDCAEQPWGCWVHRPLPHPLTGAPVVWRADREIAERICSHGIGHPDPQGAAYVWQSRDVDVTRHGCDGCCGPLPDTLEPWLPNR